MPAASVSSRSPNRWATATPLCAPVTSSDRTRSGTWSVIVFISAAPKRAARSIWWKWPKPSGESLLNLRYGGRARRGSPVQEACLKVQLLQEGGLLCKLFHARKTAEDVDLGSKNIAVHALVVGDAHLEPEPGGCPLAILGEDHENVGRLDLIHVAKCRQPGVILV